MPWKIRVDMTLGVTRVVRYSCCDITRCTGYNNKGQQTWFPTKSEEAPPPPP